MAHISSGKLRFPWLSAVVCVYTGASRSAHTPPHNHMRLGAMLLHCSGKCQGHLEGSLGPQDTALHHNLFVLCR